MPENLAAIRKLAINALQATPGPARTSHKMLQARWNNDFLLSVLAHMRQPYPRVASRSGRRI
jgi:hypothetical protein